MYDDDVFGARILAEVPTGSSEDESYVCNHLIAMQTVLSDDLVWSALDFSTDPPTQKSFRVEFDDNVVSAEFKDMFAEGKILQGVQKRRTTRNHRFVVLPSSVKSIIRCQSMVS